MATITGSQLMVEQPTERSWTKEGQLVVTRVFKGPPITALVTTKESEMRTAGADRVISTIGKNAMVRADFSDPVAVDQTPGGGIPAQDQAAVEQSVWELIGADLNKPLASHPAFNKSSGQSPVAIANIDKDVQNHSIPNPIAYETTYTAAGFVNTYAELRMQGVESWITFAYIVRSTTRLPKATTIKVTALQTSVPGTVVSWSGIGVPANAPFGQPSYFKWLGDATGSASIPINEWLVKAPQARWDGKQFELSREWWGAIEWNSKLYKH